MVVVDLICEDNLKGLFKGFDGPGTLFEFSNGSKWRQVGAEVAVKQLTMPHARILRIGGRYHIEIDGLEGIAEVVALYW